MVIPHLSRSPSVGLYSLHAHTPFLSNTQSPMLAHAQVPESDSVGETWGFAHLLGVHAHLLMDPQTFPHNSEWALNVFSSSTYKDRQTQRHTQSKSKREYFLLIRSSDAHSDCGWARSKPRAQNSIQASHVGVRGTKCFSHLLLHPRMH